MQNGPLSASALVWYWCGGGGVVTHVSSLNVHPFTLCSQCLYNYSFSSSLKLFELISRFVPVAKATWIAGFGQPEAQYCHLHG